MSIGHVRRLPWITSAMVQGDRKTYFIFGDNMARVGRGGQAAACRGEPNAIGIPTKWRPSREARDYFKDVDLDNPRVLAAIDDGFDQAERKLRAGFDVAIPTDGIGTGLAGLAQHAPRILEHIETRIRRLETIGAGERSDPGRHSA